MQEDGHLSWPPSYRTKIEAYTPSDMPTTVACPSIYLYSLNHLYSRIMSHYMFYQRKIEHIHDAYRMNLYKMYEKIRNCNK